MTHPLRIIALSPNDWFGQWVNRQQLLSRLGSKHSIIYSTGAMYVWERGTLKWNQAGWRSQIVSSDGVLVSRPGRMLLRWPRTSGWDSAVIKAHASGLRKACTGKGELVAYLCHPSFASYIDALEPDYVVYHCYDLYANQPGWNSSLEELERELLRRADLVFSPTAMLSEHLSSKVAREVRVLPNAADVTEIQQALSKNTPPPNDLATIPEPRIGYIGSIHPQLDYKLIDALADRHPEWNFVFVGDTQKSDMLRSDAALQSLSRRGNVHFLGSRHRSLIPAYLLHMSVNIMFYRLDSESWTHVAYPLKLHEYMASGKPIVSTPLPMIQEFSNVITFVQNVDSWESAIASSLLQKGDSMAAMRRNIAAQNSWEKRTSVLEGWLTELPQLREQRIQSA